MTTAGRVFLVGAGPGDPDLLTVRAARLIATAEVVVFDRLAGPAILAMIPPSARRYDVGKESGRHPVPQDEINELLIELAEAGADIVRLKGGDPFVFGRGGEEALALAQRGIAFEVVPGVTAASACAASAKIPLTLRGVADSVRLVTGHRRNDGALDLDFQRLADPNCTLVVYMGVASAVPLTEGLITAGQDPATPVLVVEKGCTPNQRLLRSRLATLADDLTRWAPEPPALLIIGRVVETFDAPLG